MTKDESPAMVPISQDELSPPSEGTVEKRDGLASSSGPSVHSDGPLEAQEPTALTRPASMTSRTVSVIQRSKRRGLLGSWTVVPEIVEAKDYSRRVKWFITFVIAMAAVAAPMGSAIFFRMCTDLKLLFWLY